jgi:hypothetical protein
MMATVSLAVVVGQGLAQIQHIPYTQSACARQLRLLSWV